MCIKNYTCSQCEGLGEKKKHTFSDTHTHNKNNTYAHTRSKQKWEGESRATAKKVVPRAGIPEGTSVH